ncbi:DNA-methyltransferase [Acinetobacter towneri]|uniref:DNA-methyltransferase n=1 Tax=Acinetobacter towneri TaxID=202956 RepID=UPI0029351088|nr:site-specific DNA-methyltransferase [Acinetobacter towneri]WOE29719.1 site-specific DNA-methyltransferase [Acinetobacter towneri]
MKFESFEPSGSFFMLNENVTLGHGDCLELMKTIPSGSVDMVLTDPPYGTTACKWDSVIPFEPMWAELKRIIKPNGAIVLFGSEPFSSALRMSNIKQYKYDWVWEKSHATGHLNAKKQPMRNNEVISVFYGKQCFYNPQLIEKNYVDKRIKSGNCETQTLGAYRQVSRSIPFNMGYPKSILKFNSPFKGGEAGLHPTQKPVALLEYLIKTYTKENEIVLDFTMGSGSTGVAAKNLNRKFIGIELDQNYFEIAKKRIQES